MTERFTIWECTECDYFTGSEARAELHAAAHCDPGSWPWEPVEVVPVGRVRSLETQLQEAREALRVIAERTGPDQSATALPRDIAHHALLRLERLSSGVGVPKEENDG